MVSVDQACNIIFSHLHRPSVKTVSLENAVGKVLAEPISADRDFPPFNRVAMDGIAINYAEWTAGRREFIIEDIQAAGAPPKILKRSAHCLEVMTGAVLPEGTDTVIRYEDLNIVDNKAVVSVDKINYQQNVHRQGQDVKEKDILLYAGVVLSPAEIALLASVGKYAVNVFAFPETAIISCGDELVDVKEIPMLHQIRRSNTYALEAAMQQLQWEGTQFHLPDDKSILEKSLHVITAKHDVLILSGGVSKGKFDFIPEVLQSIGIKKLFHQVSQRPGKPFWFGVFDAGKIVFALPGNPVSTYLCFYKYIRPWLLKSVAVTLQPLQAILASDFSFTANLTYFLQVSVRIENGKLMAYPDAGGGSGDFANLKNVTGFLELPSNQNSFKAGEIFSYIPFRIL